MKEYKCIPLTMTSTYHEANQAISFGKLVTVPPHCCSLFLLATTGLVLSVHIFGVLALGETSAYVLLFPLPLNNVAANYTTGT